LRRNAIKTRSTVKADRNRNLLRLTSFPRGRTEQCFEPDSASHSFAEQVDSDEYNKNKVYRKGRPQQEFAPSYKLPTGKDGAMFRT